MAGSGRSAARGGRKPRGSAPARRTASTDASRTRAAAPTIPPGPFRLGAVPGATPGKWIDRWQERMPQHPLVLVPIEDAVARAALTEVDVALVRLPIDQQDVHVIPLYDDLPVVVVPKDSALTAVDRLTLADLAGEVVVTADDAVLTVTVPGAVPAAFPALATTADAIATVATGTGIAIVPMSVARLHSRRDIEVRPLSDGPVSQVALAWEADRSTPLVDAFVGIVRGRTARSSRS